MIFSFKISTGKKKKKRKLYLSLSVIIVLVLTTHTKQEANKEGDTVEKLTIGCRMVASEIRESG